MQLFTKWLKPLIFFIFTLIFSNTLYAVDIKLIPNQDIVKVNGDLNNSTCHTGDIFRLRNTALFKNQPFDILLKIIDEENEADTMISKPCISVNQNSNIVTRIRDGVDENGIDDSNTGAFMDIELTIVKQNTTTALTVDNIAFTAFDLDMINFFSLSDDIYLKSPSTGYVDANTSNVTLHHGDYFNGKYDILLQGINAPTANNPQGSCIDNPAQPDKACRASGLLSSSSVFEFRVSNDDARANEPDNHRSHRMFEISLQSGDFVGLGTDHGDMPSTYGDAFHDINLSFILGTNPADSEVEQYSEDANTDDTIIIDTNVTTIDDEDAVSIVGAVSTGTEFNMTQGNTYDLNITTSGGEPGYLKAWIDYNLNGVFDNNEMMINSTIIAQTNTVYTIVSVTIPENSISGKSYLRVRYSKDDNVAASGDGGFGEVEDYVVNIISSGSLSGRVYNDKNGNATQDAGEPGLENIRVVITAENGEEHTVNTDINGNYNVSAIATGNTSINIDETTLPVGAKTTTDTTSVLIESGQNNGDAKHGYQMQANLVTLKRVDNSTPDEGSIVTYTLSVTNNGPSQATNVTLIDKLPNGLTYISHLGNGTYNENSGLWTIGTIDNSQTEILQIKATVNQNTSGNSITNVTTAAATPDQNDTTGNGDDLNETITIAGKPLVSISDAQVIEGDDLIFDINLSSASNFDTVIQITTVDGTATKLSDYGDANVTTVTIPAGELNAKVKVPTVEDTKYEGKTAETFTLNGTVTSGNTQNTDPTGIGSIVDNDTGVLQANDDEVNATVGDEVVINILENDVSDIPLDPSTVKIIDPETNTSVTELVVPGEGTWTVNPNTGSITFVPLDDLVGDPTPISYTVEDEEGTVSNPAKISVNYAQGTIAGIVYVDTNANSKQDLGEVGIPNVKIVITDVQDKNTTLITDVKGEYTLEVPAGNTTIMIDETTFSGGTQTEGTNPTVLTVLENTITRDVDGFAGTDAPKAVDDTVENVQTGESVTIDVLSNDTDLQNDIDPTTVKIVDTNGNEVTQLIIPGEGTWSVDTTNGKITFTPEAGYTGDPTSIQYTVEDSLGNTSNPASVTVKYAQDGPVAGDDNASADVGDTVTIDVLTNDKDEQNDINKSTVGLIGPNGIEGIDTDDDGDIDTLTIPHEGTWHVNENGVVTFVPISGFTDDPTPIKYTVSDETGGISNEANIAIDVQQVLRDDTGSAYIGDPATLNILTNDDTVNKTTVSLHGPAGSSGEDTDGDGDIDELVVPGEGIWKVDNNGILIFTPEKGFTGNPTPITYTAKDNNGNILEAASVTVEYSPKPRVTPTPKPTPKPHNVTVTQPEEPEVAFQNDPVAQDDNLTIYDESPHSSDVSINDIFMSGDVFNIIDPVTSSLVAESEVIRLKYGTVSMQADGKYTYTPYPETLTIDGYVEETFQYKISRVTGESDMANVLVSVNCVCMKTSDADALDGATMFIFIFMMGMLGLYFIGKEEIAS